MLQTVLQSISTPTHQCNAFTSSSTCRRVMPDEDQQPQQRGTKRKWPLPDPAPTVPDAPATKRGFRWPIRLRVLLVSLLLAAMPVETQYAMMRDSVVPTEPKSVMRAAYASVYEGVKAYMWQDVKDSVSFDLFEQDIMPSHKAVREAAAKYALRSITSGSVLDLPPHEPGYKDEARQPFMERLVELLRLGYKDVNGDIFVYRNIEHACAINQEINTLCTTSLALKTARSVWIALKNFCPAIYHGLVKTKKKRDKLKTQVRLSPQFSLHRAEGHALDAEHVRGCDQLSRCCCMALVSICVLLPEVCIIAKACDALRHNLKHNLHAELRQASAGPPTRHLPALLQDGAGRQALLHAWLPVHVGPQEWQAAVVD